MTQFTPDNQTNNPTTPGIPLNVPAFPRPDAPDEAGPDNATLTGADADALLADKARRDKIEGDLRRMGLSPVEVQRLLNADSRTSDPDAADMPPVRRNDPTVALPAMPALPAQNRKAAAKNAARESMQSMQSFAADLMAQKAAAQTQAIREVKLDIPPPRLSSQQELRQSEPLLRDAAMLRRKEKYREAEIKVREALQYVPGDAAALELLGDILQGVARTDEALAVYKRAQEADPKRSSAERKYGELLVLQQNWSRPDPEAVEGNSWFARMLSLILPGLGQFHNGEIGKGIFFLALDAVCIYLLFYSPFGFSHQHRLTTPLIICLVLTVVVYIVAFVDTSAVLKQGRKSL